MIKKIREIKVMELSGNPEDSGVTLDLACLLAVQARNIGLTVGGIFK